MNSYFILTIQSKNIFAITKFIRVFIKMAEFHFNYTKKLWWTKKKKKVFTILKSPHVNKSSQEQYEINKFYKQFIVRITQKFKFLVFLKTLKANLLPEVHCSVEFIYNKKVSINYFVANILNPTHFLLLSGSHKKFAKVKIKLKKKIYKTYLIKKNIFYKIFDILYEKLLKILYLKKINKKCSNKNKIIVKLIESNEKYKINKKIIKKVSPKNICNKKLKLKKLIKKIVKSKKRADKKLELKKIDTRDKKYNVIEKKIEKNFNQIFFKKNSTFELWLNSLTSKSYPNLPLKKKFLKSKELTNKKLKLKKIGTWNKKHNVKKKNVEKIVLKNTCNKKLIKKIVKSKELANKKLKLKKISTWNKRYNVKKKIVEKIVLKNIYNKKLIKKIVKSKELANKKLELKKINTRNNKYNVKKKIIKKVFPKKICNKKLKFKKLIKKIVKSKKLADKKWALKKKIKKKPFKKKLLNGKIVLYSLFDSSVMKLTKKNKLKIYEMILNNKLLDYFFTIYIYQFFNKNFIMTINSFLISLNLYGKAVKSIFNINKIK